MAIRKLENNAVLLRHDLQIISERQVSKKIIIAAYEPVISCNMVYNCTKFGYDISRSL